MRKIYFVDWRLTKLSGSGMPRLQNHTCIQSCAKHKSKKYLGMATISVVQSVKVKVLVESNYPVLGNECSEWRPSKYKSYITFSLKKEKRPKKKLN